MTTSKPNWQRAERLAEIAERNEMDIRLYTGYAEPGYDSDQPVAIGNWNNKTRWLAAEHRFETIDKTPSRIGSALEACGFDLQWEDEWTECTECYRPVRTQPDCYHWTPSYVDTGDGPVCLSCVDWPSELSALEGQTQHAVPTTCNPEDHEYWQPIEQPFETGFDLGQADSMTNAVKVLQELGLESWLFQVTEQSQFYHKWTFWLHERERSAWSEHRFNQLYRQGPEPAAMLRKALAGPLPKRQEGKIAVTHVDLSTGTATTEHLSPEQFTAGKH